MTFVKGQPRHPNGGRRKGTPNKGTERAKRLIAEGDDKKIIDETIKAAIAGDRAAQTLYYRHLRPPLPRYLGPLAYQAPKDIDEARAKILELGEQLAEGKIPAELHDSLVNGLRAYLNDKSAEQEKRLLELEALLPKREGH